jgi:hypothetical protein
MSKETALFWNDLRERLCPPAGNYLVFHSIWSNHAIKTGKTLDYLTQSIINNGLFAPKDYSVITLKFESTWTMAGEVVDFIFYSFSKPTDETGADRDSATQGFTLRDPVLNADFSIVPEFVRRLFPEEKNFVYVPPADLCGVMTWHDSGLRFDLEKKIKRIVNEVHQGGQTMSEGVDDINRELYDCPIKIVSGIEVSDLARRILTNSIRVLNNHNEYLKAQKVWSQTVLP